MPTRSSTANWQGTLKEGAGTMRLASGAYEGPFSYVSRFEEGPGTNPEELIAAAHAGCFSMALAAQLETTGIKPESIRTSATVTLEKVADGFSITEIHLDTVAVVPGGSQLAFETAAALAQSGCPVSK